jgi:hypothetical protein
MTATRSFLAATGFAALAALIPFTANGATKELDKVGVGKAIAAACSVTSTKVEALSAKYADISNDSSSKVLSAASADYKTELDALTKSLKAIKVTSNVDGGRTKQLIDLLTSRSAYQGKVITAMKSAKDSAGVKKAMEALSAERAKGGKAAQAIAKDLKTFGYACSVLPPAE